MILRRVILLLSFACLSGLVPAAGRSEEAKPPPRLGETGIRVEICVGDPQENRKNCGPVLRREVRIVNGVPVATVYPDWGDQRSKVAGKVSANRPKIACPPKPCKVNVTHGARVALKASRRTAYGDFKFEKWLGLPCEGRRNPTCTVTATRNKVTRVVAVFVG